MPSDEIAPTATNSYFAALGRFVNAYSRIEVGLHVLFRHCLGLGDAGRVLSAGQNAGRLINLTIRIARARNLPQETIDEMRLLFTQLQHISNLRDSLIHRGAEIYGEDMISSNVITASSVEEAQILRFNLNHITAATTDCSTIFLRMALIVNPDAPTLQTEDAKRALGRAWLYRPLQQENPYRRPRADQQSTPPESS